MTALESYPLDLAVSAEEVHVPERLLASPTAGVVRAAPPDLTVTWAHGASAVAPGPASASAIAAAAGPMTTRVASSADFSSTCSLMRW